MTTTLELRDLIKSALVNVGCPVYEYEADNKDEYPYAVFEISTSSADDFPKSGYLEINVWDRHRTYSTVDTYMDKIEGKLKNQYFSNEKVAFRCFDGDRSHILDEDKAIKRTREKFMIRYNAKGE